MSIKEQVKALWKMCFEDTEEFIELYFRKRYADSINHIVERDGKAVAALQTIPYPMTYGGELLPISYISGACTHPSYRNQGVMKQLLEQVHRRVYEEGVAFSTLIPAEEWLKAYYARSGYAVCFRYGVERRVMNSLPKPVDNFDARWNLRKVEPCSPDFETVYSFFEEQMRKRPCCIQHTVADFEVILEDLKLSGGACWAVTHAGKLLGVFCCVPHSEYIEVKEMLLIPPVSTDTVLTLLAVQYQKEKIEILVPSSDSLFELGMARVIRVESCLDRYAQLHPQEERFICVEGDEAIPENNGCYQLAAGKCRRVSDTPSVCTTCTIPELTKLLLDCETPYMSLMLD